MLGELNIYETSDYYTAYCRFWLGGYKFLFQFYYYNKKNFKIPRKIKPPKNYMRWLFCVCSYSWYIEENNKTNKENQLTKIYYTPEINIDREFILDYFKGWLYMVDSESDEYYEVCALKKILKCQEN